MAKFKVGQVYRSNCGNPEKGNIIKIAKTFGEWIEYDTIRGAQQATGFVEGSFFAEGLVLLTSKEIGKAIRKYDAEHSKTGVREVKRRAKVGEYIKILKDCCGSVKPGKIGKITSNEETVEIDGHDGFQVQFITGDYVVLEGYKPEQRGKHSYTAEQIAEAKKLCGEMIVEAFDDGSTFNLRFLDKNRSESDNIVHCDVARLNGKANATGVAKCSGHDEYNVWIGRCVALCKALHKPIPNFIMGD